MAFMNHSTTTNMKKNENDMSEKKKRSDNIVAVTVARYAVMYIEADTPEEAVKYAKKHCDDVDDDDFFDGSVEIDSYETYVDEARDWMKKIWVEDGNTLTYDEYLDELEEQEEDDELQLKLFED